MKGTLGNIGNTGMHMMGKTSLLVENYESMIEYTEIKIRLQARGYRISVEGRGLMIEYFNEDELQVSGNIERVVFV